MFSFCQFYSYTVHTAYKYEHFVLKQFVLVGSEVSFVFGNLFRKSNHFCFNIIQVWIKIVLLTIWGDGLFLLNDEMIYTKGIIWAISFLSVAIAISFLEKKKHIDFNICKQIIVVLYIIIWKVFSYILWGCILYQK